MGETELTKDVISTMIDRDLFDWLMKTAATASHPDQVYAMTAGAVAGIVRFCWAQRQPDMTAESLADAMMLWVRDYCHQASDADGTTVQ